MRRSSDTPSSDYPDALVRAVDAARRHARGVLLAFSVAETTQQRSARSAVQIALTRAFGSPPWLRIVDLDGDERLLDPAWRVDGWDYGSGAVALVAERLASALLSLVQALPA